MTAPVATERTVAVEEPAGICRYSLWERLLHWEVAVTFVALMLSGMALAYPRLAWLSGLFGGGQTMRASHPWIGLAFTVGLVAMLLLWARDMRPEPTDRVWVHRLRTYIREGHSGVDVGRFNAGQKGYFWFSVFFGIVLLVSGLPLWFPSIASAGWREAARLVHQASYLLMVAGFIIHVYMSTVLLPGTMSAMTTGRVSRRWAAWHHPRWYRQQQHESRHE
jgi:formate dehydrogenase subunit gamma